MNYKKETTIQRNESLAFRFYELREIQRLRMDDVLSILSKEYFLSEFRIMTLLKMMQRQGVTIEGRPLEIKRYSVNF